MPRRSGPARWPLVLLAAAFAGLGILVVAQPDGKDEDAPPPDRDATAVVTTTTVETAAVEGDPDPIRVERGDYSITYRVEGFTDDGGAVIDLERRWVRVPYASRVETVPEDDEDAPPTFLQIGDFGILQTGREDEEPLVLHSEPSMAPGDVRIDVDLDAAIDAGVLEWRHEERTILERRCQVFRAGSPVDVATLSAPDDAEESWADLCLGDDGLLLQEEWIIAGNLFRRRTVVEIDESPRLTDDLFDATGTVADGPEGGSLTELTEASVPPGVAFYALESAPAGFTRRGRFGYSPPREVVDFSAAEPVKVALILDVYEDGAGGILVVANGGTSNYSALVEVGPDDATVDLGAIGPAEIVLGLRQNELRAGFERGRFLRVWGTLDIAELTSIARSLTATTDPNGQVTPKD